jgi:hypothetical protein
MNATDLGLEQYNSSSDDDDGQVGGVDNPVAIEIDGDSSSETTAAEPEQLHSQPSNEMSQPPPAPARPDPMMDITKTLEELEKTPPPRGQAQVQAAFSQAIFEPNVVIPNVRQVQFASEKPLTSSQDHTAGGAEEEVTSSQTPTSGGTEKRVRATPLIDASDAVHGAESTSPISGTADSKVTATRRAALEAEAQKWTNPRTACILTNSGVAFRYWISEA